MKSITIKAPTNQPTNRRACKRQVIAVPARLAWKDQRGASRFASVITRDVSESGIFVEYQSSWPIPLYRLVQFQVEPTAARWHDLPESLRQGRILSAVYRVSHDTTTGRCGIALRLMVDPHELQLSIGDLGSTIDDSQLTIDDRQQPAIQLSIVNR